MTGNNGHVVGLLVLGAILIGVLGCGDDDPAGATPTNDIDNQLVFTRPDSTEIAIGTQYAICCGIWEAGFIDKNTLKIFFFGASQQESFWKLFLIVDEIQVGEAYSLPTDASSPLRMFAFDAGDQNELSSDDEASTGTITVQIMDCGPPLEVRVTVDAVLGSEFNFGPPLAVSGEFRATVHSNPASFGCDFSM